VCPVTVHFVVEFMKLRNVVTTVVVDGRGQQLKPRPVAASWVTDMLEYGSNEEVTMNRFYE
jgi:hypothetical protein